MSIKEFAVYLDKLEKTSSRIEITKILAELFRKIEISEIKNVSYLLLGILAPSYQSLVFNLADRMMVRVIAMASGKSQDEVNKLYKKSGDLGVVSENLLNSKGSEGNIGVNEIFKKLTAVARNAGDKSQERKITEMVAIVKQCDSLSAKYIVRIPTGNLRLGFSDKTIIDALSWMVKGDKSASAEITSAFEVLPDIGAIAEVVKKEGTSNLKEKVKPVVGVPVMPMLAQRLKSPDEMIAKMGVVAVEPKFDGLRVLIHYDHGKIRAFTRNLNDISPMFTELGLLEKYLNADSAILDSEAVGLDPRTKKMVDFQTTMQRRRKHDIKKVAADIPINFQIFDILYKDGRSFLGEPYSIRREVLGKIIKKNKIFFVDEYTLTKDPNVIRREHKKMLSYGLEGVIVKKVDSKYVPGRTGWRWVKMKEVETASGKLADTIDCVVMGYTQGKGKRASFGIGQFLAGIIDGDSVKTVSKVGTGLTDMQFRQLAKRLRKIQVKEKPKEYEVHKDLYPDFWVKPEIVVELAADEITKSPKHTAGLALRFPRLITFRDDKSPAEATTSREVARLMKFQRT